MATVMSMKTTTPLDFAVFQLNEARTRCELWISAADITEKLASGPLKPFVVNLREAAEQLSRGATCIRMQAPSVVASGSPWFTKGTLERFIRFISAPDILERAAILETERLKLAEASSILISDSSSGNGPVLNSTSEAPKTATSDIYGRVKAMESKNMAKLTEESVDVAIESSKKNLLSAMEARRLALLKEQRITFAKASVLGFSTEAISNLIVFADCFGAPRLRDACLKFLTLSKKREEIGLNFEEFDCGEVSEEDARDARETGVILCESAIKLYVADPILTASKSAISRASSRASSRKSSGSDHDTSSIESSHNSGAQNSNLVGNDSATRNCRTRRVWAPQVSIVTQQLHALSARSVAEEMEDSSTPRKSCQLDRSNVSKMESSSQGSHSRSDLSSDARSHVEATDSNKCSPMSAALYNCDQRVNACIDPNKDERFSDGYLVRESSKSKQQHDCKALASSHKKLQSVKLRLPARAADDMIIEECCEGMHGEICNQEMTGENSPGSEGLDSAEHSSSDEANIMKASYNRWCRPPRSPSPRRRSISPRRKFQVGRSPIRRTSVIVVKNIRDATKDKKNSISAESDTESDLAEKDEESRAKKGRLSVQDAITLFEKRQQKGLSNTFKVKFKNLGRSDGGEKTSIKQEKTHNSIDQAENVPHPVRQVKHSQSKSVENFERLVKANGQVVFDKHMKYPSDDIQVLPEREQKWAAVQPLQVAEKDRKNVMSLNMTAQDLRDDNFPKNSEVAEDANKFPNEDLKTMEVIGCTQHQHLGSKCACETRIYSNVKLAESENDYDRTAKKVVISSSAYVLDDIYITHRESGMQNPRRQSLCGWHTSMDYDIGAFESCAPGMERCEDDADKHSIRSGLSPREQKGRFYEQYQERREAKYKSECSSARSQREAKLKAMHEVLERRKSELVARSTRLSEKHNTLHVDQLKATKVQALKATILKGSKEKVQVQTGSKFAEKTRHSHNDKSIARKSSPTITYTLSNAATPKQESPNTRSSSVSSARKISPGSQKSCNSTPRNSARVTSSPKAITKLSITTGTGIPKRGHHSVQQVLVENCPSSTSSSTEPRKENTRPPAGRNAPAGAKRSQSKISNVNNQQGVVTEMLPLEANKGTPCQAPQASLEEKKVRNGGARKSVSENQVLAPIKSSKIQADSKISRRQAGQIISQITKPRVEGCESKIERCNSDEVSVLSSMQNVDSDVESITKMEECSVTDDPGAVLSHLMQAAETEEISALSIWTQVEEPLLEKPVCSNEEGDSNMCGPAVICSSLKLHSSRDEDEPITSVEEIGEVKIVSEEQPPSIITCGENSLNITGNELHDSKSNCEDSLQTCNVDPQMNMLKDSEPAYVAQNEVAPLHDPQDGDASSSSIASSEAFTDSQTASSTSSDPALMSVDKAPELSASSQPHSPSDKAPLFQLINTEHSSKSGPIASHCVGPVIQHIPHLQQTFSPKIENKEEAVQEKKNWGHLQKILQPQKELPSKVVSLPKEPPKEHKGLRRLLKFGRKSRNSESSSVKGGDPNSDSGRKSTTETVAAAAASPVVNPTAMATKSSANNIRKSAENIGKHDITHEMPLRSFFSLTSFRSRSSDSRSRHAH